MGQLGAFNLFTTIETFLKETFGTTNNFQIYFYAIIAAMLFGIIVSIIAVRMSYEVRLLKCVGGFNKYFRVKPFITEENLIEFNNKMKQVPETVRSNWQQYMLNREEEPSKYINAETCVERPLKTSAIDKTLSNMTVFTILLCVVSVLLITLGYVSAGTTNFAVIIANALILPVVLLVLYTLYSVIFHSWKNSVQGELFENFHNFQRNVNKAVTTLPFFIDYELLFTRKEIKKNIPILQEYLDKRALLEQQELEKARLSTMETEKFNFDELGINGSLVLERAMKECEMYLTARRRLQTECDQIETEKDNYSKNFDISTKEYQRKIQASRENLESLKAQQEASTNRIESNYIKKQQADEMKKQELIEKENDEATTRYKEEQETLAEEIKKRKEDIEEKRKAIESAMKSEFKNYANVVYKELEGLVKKDIKDKIASLTTENNELKESLSAYQNGVGQTEDYIVPNTEVIPEVEIEDDTASDNEFAGFDQDVTAVAEDKADDSLFDTSATADVPEVELETEAQPQYKDIEWEAEDSETNEQPQSTPEEEPITAPASGIYSDSKAVTSGVVTEDELEELQRRIEEENKKLFKQKQDFAQEIEQKIDEMDKPSEVEVEEAPKPVEKKKPAPRKSASSKGSTPVERKPRAKSKSATTKKAPAKKAAPKKPAKATSVKKPKTTVADELDDVSAEMEALLKNIKK